MIVTKQSGGNTVQICRDVRKEVERIKKTLPSDVKIEMIYDSSESIESAVNSLEESIHISLNCRPWFSPSASRAAVCGRRLSIGAWDLC